MLPDADQPLLHLTYRPDLDILFGRWAYQPDPHDLPVAYQQIQTAALQEHCRFWLQDIRRRTVNDPSTAEWLLKTYFPAVASHLRGRLYVAYLVSPTLHETIVNRPDFMPAQPQDDHSFVTAFFGDEGAATKWLQAQQSAVAR